MTHQLCMSHWNAVLKLPLFFKENSPVQIRDRASTRGSYFSIIDKDFIFLIKYFTVCHEAEGNMADRFRICCTYLINRFNVHRMCHFSTGF